MNLKKMNKMIVNLYNKTPMLRQITFIILVIFQFPMSANSQQFEVINAGIVGVGRSSVSWADYDKDGDLDILVTGNTGSGPYVAAIYRNDLGSFININAGLTGIDNSSVAWGDYDNDGDPDILATGRSTGSTNTWLYRNDNGVFISINSVFPEIGSYGSVSWGDIDGDADLDALISR
ncbi:MAG: VCBS repeat-containing protein [Bacteroidales bacterium]|nr:VCBS repeat-containing protein [Bacteroidales bacterium]